MSHKNFTSETLRLEPTSSSNSVPRDNDPNQLLPASVIGQNSQNFQKKKVSSFQITSIRPTSSHSSNDGGDDSENDTEDTSDILDSSRVTADLDQETPSFSEDYSKSEDILLGLPPPIIPTSSQYSITAVVHQAGSGGMMTARLPQGVTVNVTEEGLALAKAEGESDDLDNWQNRFTIVKINSNEPITRGRWVCLDFMDSPAVNSTGSKSEEIPNLVVSNVVLPDGDTSKPPTHGVQIPISGSHSTVYLPSMPTQQSFPCQISQGGVIGAIPQIPIVNISIPSSGQVTSVSVQSGIQYLPNSQVTNISQGYSTSQPTPGSAHPSGLPTQASASTSQPLIHGDTEILGNSRINSSANIPQAGIQVGVQPGLVTNSVTHPQSEKSHPQQTLGTTGQNVIGAPISGQGIPTPILGVSNQNQASHPSTTMPIPRTQSHQVSQHGLNQGMSSQPPTQNLASTQQIPSSIQSLQSVNPQGALATTVNISSATATTVNASYNSHPNTGATPTPATTPAQQSNIINIGSNQPSMDPHLQQSLMQPSVVTGTLPPPSTSRDAPLHPNTLEGIPSSSQGQESSGPTTATPPTGIAMQADDTESASTASTVAIDNKIEQAMDLVKSHLMFAVREEVEVLKERIVDLMDRIHNLECENTLLRQYASQDALQQIQQQMQQQSQQQQQQQQQQQTQQLPQSQQQPPHHSSTS